MKYEAVIGLEVHAEMQTESKMFCGCPVVDATTSEPNTAVCPVCSGMPGVLPVVNQKAVEYALRVALALDCEIARTSIFARKNYFYPDLPKGYQISQYEYPLAQFGKLTIDTSAGERTINITRVHMEEDTGKLTHITPPEGDPYSLVDLNRAGVSLLEIVSEPEMHSAEEAVSYGTALRDIVRALGVNSGDMEKGVIRFEANVSIRPVGSTALGTRVEIKNLNTFRGMERAINYEIDRQTAIVEQGGSITQETLGWDETRGETYSQRSKEEAHDYRYFPEPDLPPLVVETTWVEEIKSSLPELPRARYLRFMEEYDLSAADAKQISADPITAAYYEQAVTDGKALSPKLIANWMTGPLFAWLNTSSETITKIKVDPPALVKLLETIEAGTINQPTAKTVLETMLRTGQNPLEIIQEQGLEQVSDTTQITEMVARVLRDNPTQLEAYLAGKETLSNWFFGQVMRAAQGKVNPQLLRQELQRQLETAST